MATFARDRSKRRIAELVRGSPNEVHGAGVAEEASAGDLVRKIQIRFFLVARRHVPAFGLRVIGNRRFKQVLPQPNYVGISDYADPHRSEEHTSELQSP